MKKFNYLIMTILLFLIPVISFGMVQEEVPNVDLSDPNVLIGLATAALTLAATWAVKKVIPVINGLGTLVAVALIAGAITALDKWMNVSDMAWGLQLGSGLLSVFLHQFYVKVKELPAIEGPK
jgi:hypothetical protein